MEVDKQRIAELVSQIQSGDNSAFDELYKLTSERAYFVALEFTKNNQDAEDILQESYIKALSKISELDKPESFSSWLNQIVANKSKDFLKKKKPMLFNSDEEETDATELLPDEDTSFSPEENLDQTELQKTVMEVLDELSEEKRACVLMMYFEELSVGEIAETLEIPEGTVKTRLFSARKDLKDKFAKRGITSAYSVAPIGVVIWALRRMSDAVSKTFVGSGASAKVLAGITVAGAGTAASVAVAGTTAATTAAATVGTGSATATGAAATGTGIAAKIAALTVAQKVVAGVSVVAVVAGGTVGVVTVANNDDKKDDISTTAYTEEYITSPSFETTLVVDALGTVEFSDSTALSSNESTSTNSSTSKNSTTNHQSTTGKTTAKSTSSSAKQTTTTKNQTTSKVTTTLKPTTTKKQTTTKATTTEKETTTKKVTTTKETTTERQTTTTKPTTTTTKPTTTEATTKGKATVIIEYMEDGSSEVKTITLTIDEGTAIDSAYVRNHMKNNYGYSIVVIDSGEETSSAVANETYSFSLSCA
ncbi:MAG: RNA polymerase sigma factor [Clostridia bacterium]|nr:RNA polymerase sigma factor [Clostridia bacterium]